VQLVSKFFNLCDPDPPTLQTDRQTDDMQSQHRALHYSASRGKNEITYEKPEERHISKFVLNNNLTTKFLTNRHPFFPGRVFYKSVLHKPAPG